jgi:hypothetical protein
MQTTPSAPSGANFRAFSESEDADAVRSVPALSQKDNIAQPTQGLGAENQKSSKQAQKDFLQRNLWLPLTPPLKGSCEG